MYAPCPFSATKSIPFAPSCTLGSTSTEELQVSDALSFAPGGYDAYFWDSR